MPCSKCRPRTLTKSARALNTTTPSGSVASPVAARTRAGGAIPTDAVPRTATASLNNASLPYALRLAEGVEEALVQDAGLAAGLNARDGRITCAGVAEAYPDLAAAD